MRFLKVFLIIAVAFLSVLVLPSLMRSDSRFSLRPIMVSYNPYPANNFHAPLSSMGLIGLANATATIQTSGSGTAASQSSSPSGQSIRQNALRFTIDNSYFPQTETTIAIDPGNTSHVVGGFNDQKFFFCGALPVECGTISSSISGFTSSTDGGKTVAKSNDIPNIAPFGVLLNSFGDPSVAPSVDGNFFYASLAISRSSFANGIMIAKSNSSLFDNSVSCDTASPISTSNACWNTVFVFGNLARFASTFEDKDRITVDRNPASPFYGSVYVGWDHFDSDGTSSSYLARCDNNLSSCPLVSGGAQPIVSGSDIFPAWTTPVVDKNGNVYVTWCNFGTFTTFGPVSCRISSSSPGGTGFGPATTILSFMGADTTFPGYTVPLGWATETFRTFSLPSLAVDLSDRSNNLYFAIQVCASGHYYAFPSDVAPVANDNPGDCGNGAILFSRSTNGGSVWSDPISLSKPAVNDQPFVTVDSLTGQVYVVYYTTQFDQWNHRIDVVASVSNNRGQNFHQSRVTIVSNEPNSDPNMYNYIRPNGIGGSFSVPQYGDYIEATARGGTLWVLFTGNYQSEDGTFQTDPFLAVLNSQGML